MEERTTKSLDREALWSYALKILTGRARSIGEVKDKLRRRCQSNEDVEAVLTRLKECGYLDDSRFAEGYAAARLSGGRTGRNRVVRDLRQRRVAPALAQQTVEQVYRDVDEEALIVDW